MKQKRLVPENKTVEGWLSISQQAMNIDILKLYGTGTGKAIKTKLTPAQKELFAGFYHEQQRLNRIAEIQYLKRYLLEQRNTVNEIASVLKKRDAAEIKKYGKIPVFENTKEYYQGAPAGKFKITNDLADLRNKVHRLDKILRDSRSIVNRYEMIDFDRTDKLNGGGWWERMLATRAKKRRKSQLKKVT